MCPWDSVTAQFFLRPLVYGFSPTKCGLPSPCSTLQTWPTSKMVKRVNLGSGLSREERDSSCSSHLSHGLSPNQTAIKRNNPRKFLRSVGDGETVEFDVVEGEKVWGPMVEYRVD